MSSQKCRNRQRYAGLGFVFSTEDAFAGIDLDDSLDEHGDLKDWARGIVERFSDTYMEIPALDASVQASHFCDTVGALDPGSRSRCCNSDNRKPSAGTQRGHNS